MMPSSNLLDPEMGQESVDHDHYYSFQGSFKRFYQRIRTIDHAVLDSSIADGGGIKSLENDVDFVLVVRREQLSKANGTRTNVDDDDDDDNNYNHEQQQQRQKRQRQKRQKLRRDYIQDLCKYYHVRIKQIQGREHDFYLLQLPFNHLGLLAEMFRYQWRVTSNDASKVAYDNLSFFKWLDSERNAEFETCRSRQDFSPRQRFELTFHFLTGATVLLEEPNNGDDDDDDEEDDDGKQELEIAQMVEFNLSKVFSEKLFDDWLIPHSKINNHQLLLDSKSNRCCCFSCVTDCQTAFGECRHNSDDGDDDDPNRRAGESDREYLIRYHTLRTALIRHRVPSPASETSVGANLWHLIPIEAIVNYVGERIGFYFAWVELLILTMVFPAAIGTAFFIIMSIYYSVQVHADDSVVPFAERAESVFAQTCDNYGTPAFSILMIVWGTVFAELWTRRESWYRFLWNCEQVDDEKLENVAACSSSFQPPPPTQSATDGIKDTAVGDAAGAATDGASGNSTGIRQQQQQQQRQQKQQNRWIRFGYFALSGLVTLCFIGLVCISVYLINVINFFSFNFCPLSKQQDRITFDYVVCQLFGASQVFANSVSVFVLNMFYTQIAYKLTDWEQHTQPSRYSQSLVLKLFIFRFVNFYAILFFTSFAASVIELNQVIPADQLNYAQASGADTCGAQNCLIKLTKQLLALLITQPVLNITRGLFGVPCVKWVKRVGQMLLAQCPTHCRVGPVEQEPGNRNSNDVDDDEMAAELELQQTRMMHLSELGRMQFTADEFTERVIHFGALIMFSVALPPASAICIIFMRIDLSLDVRRM